MICNICPRKCNVDRENTLGFCQSPQGFSVSRAALHFWEEPCISGKNGSGTVFFSGCNLKCVFCQNYEISHLNKGCEISDKRLVEIFENLIEQGANNINLVNPSHYSKQLYRVLSGWKSPVPVVYNTSGYDDVETLKCLEGLIDIYLPDFKYIRPEKAKKYSFAQDYPSVAMKALAEMRRQQSTDVFNDKGIMQKGMIIRHLILPSNTNSSIECIDYLHKEFGNTYISLMAQYTPWGDLTNYKEIDRKISQREYDKVLDYTLGTGHEKLYIQELSSADSGYIPKFDFTGVL